MALNFMLASAFAGVIATFCLLMSALWAHRLGLPRLDFARAMADLTYGETYNGSPPYISGNLIIYMNGIFFALFYASVFAPLIPGPPLLRGILWGLVLFVASGLFYVPVILKEGLFLSKIHKDAWMSSLLVHAVWGAVIGWLSPIAGYPT